jgi:hypothetical protein
MKAAHLRILILSGILSLACTTKVSEWVLLNSEANNYILAYYHKDPVVEGIKKQNEEIGREISSANIQFRTVLRKDIEKPYYALIYRNRLFSTYSSYTELKNLSVSPLREKIASELMSGMLCTMLYLKTGNPEKDDSALRTIKGTVAASPYREVLSVTELDRNSPDEKHFVSMLLNVESDLKEINEPMLFGIFARFKALEPLLAKGISAENINLMIDFLTADCSCLIKDNLPGTDILFTNNWENPLPALVNRILDENPALLHH